jgi:hypothetical protein
MGFNSSGATPMITVKMDSKLLQKRLAEIGVDVTNDANASLKQHARLLAQNLAFQTAPFGLSKASQKMGENTILGDIVGRTRKGDEVSTNRQPLFFVINESQVQKNFKKTPSGIQKLFVNKDGRVYGVEETFFKPNASIEEMRAHHKKYFKNGRRTRAGSFTRDIGRWRFIDKMTVGKQSLKNYLKWIYQRVGMSKAGWVKAGSVFGKVTKIPAWVSRHVASARGSGKMHKIGPHSFAVTLTNHIPWSDRIMGKSGMEAALQITKEKYLDHLRHKKLGTKRKK